LVRNDSTDVDAWYGYGDCLYHDPVIEAINGDTTRLRWRSDFNASLRAFQRALDVDPTYHLAYQHLVDAFAQQVRQGRYCVGSRCTAYVSVLQMTGDSLAPSPPIALPRDTALFRSAWEEYARNGTKRRSLERALRTANQWVDANASEHRARFNLGTVLLLLGRVESADSALAPTQIAGNGQAASLLALERFEIAVKRWRAADALRLFDSVRASPGIVFGTGARAVFAGNFISLSGPTLGRFAGFDSVLAAQMALGGLTGPSARVGREIPRLLFGAPSDSLVVAERGLLERVAAGSATPVERIFAGLSLSYGLRLPRPSWPPIDTTARDLKLRPAIAMARGDSSALRRAARSLDSLSSVYMAGLIPDTGVTIVAADAYLALGDSLAALRMTRRMLDTALASAPIAALSGGGTLVQPMIPRAMLLRADLASALGQKDEARLWYKRFLDLWAKADPEFQPLVDRVKKSYAALGP
jgi:tetratricopeptide (TPR) repeat protein